MSLFSILLSCFTMERTLFSDYEGRLNLDHVLIRIRTEFEQHKEHVRECLNVRYKVDPPTAQSMIHKPERRNRRMSVPLGPTVTF
jgi:hypothetical protein